MPNKLWRDISSALGFGGGRQNEATSSSRTRGAIAGIELKDDVISFGDFIAVRLPPEPPSRLSKDEVLQKYASDTAEIIREALVKLGIVKYSLMELYMSGEIEDIITKIFGINGLKTFERIFETEIFGLGSMSSSISTDTAPRVYLVPRQLGFHAAFDPILNGRLIVRPLGSGQMPVPVNPAEADFESDQLLIGLFQIFELDRTQLAQAPIWVWRSVKDQNTIIIDVDFDLFTRAFPEPDLHIFPLGLAIRCKFRQAGGVRLIEAVSMDISVAKKWIEYLQKVSKADSVTYYIDTGRGGASFEKDLLKNHSLNIIEVKREASGDDFPLGTDEFGNERKIPINRLFSIFVKSGERSYAYRFGFFERALNYVPAKNIMSVSGQLIPQDEAIDVMLPPGYEEKQEPIFHLTPDPSSNGHFKLRVARTTTLSLTMNSQPLRQGSDIDVEIGDEIKATSDARVVNRAEEYRFQIQDLNGIPSEVCNRDGRPYVAFVKVTAPQERQFTLYDKEHVFGRGQFFSDNAVGMSPGSLKFKRPWVFLKMFPGAGQKIFYLNKSTQAVGARKHAVLLPDEGYELELNAVYEVYLGDFQITLNLKATPSSSYI
jgi:hypothetical protein